MRHALPAALILLLAAAVAPAALSDRRPAPEPLAAAPFGDDVPPAWVARAIADMAQLLPIAR
jgi:hypothetical protein